MAHRLRWGLLGTARINQQIMPALRNSINSELYAVGSRSAERAAEYARDWKIPHFYPSYEALLADPRLDVVYNSLPNHLHTEWTIKALQAGKHVLVEKPFALSIIEATRMAAAVEKAGVYLTEALVYRAFEQTRKIMEIIRSGEIGKVVVVRGVFTFSQTRPEDFRLDPKMGGGSIWDVGVYPVSFIHMIAGGAPDTVFGMQQTAPSGVDETLVGQMQYAGGLFGQFVGSFNSPRHTGVDIQGTAGMLAVPLPFSASDNNQVILRKSDRDPEKVFTYKIDNRFQDMVDEFSRSIIDRQPPLVSPEESCQIVATLAALVESSRSGRPVRITAKDGLVKPAGL
jgi:D-xylose 1-dehydrogenase (NADP+, D-xylono-1,5-lactone-forming)